MAKGKYETHVLPYLEQIAAMCRNGATDKDIYITLNISEDSFYRYKKEHSEFSEALKENKEFSDFRVENSLNKNANGYEYEEEVVVMKKEIIYNENGKKQKEMVYPVKVSLRKYKEAETKAQQFWLQNRKPKDWRNQAEVNLNVKKLEDILNGNNSETDN